MARPGAPRRRPRVPDPLSAAARPDLTGFAVNLELWWPDLAPVDRVAAAARAGFAEAEIWYWPRWDVDALAAACERHGVRIAQLGCWDFEPRLDHPDSRAAFRRAVAAAVPVARRLGATLLNVNGPVLGPGDDPSVVRARVVEALRGAVDVGADAGVRLMIEPMNVRVDHPDYALPTSADVLAVCDAVASSALGVNWDCYHLQISEGDLSGHLAEGMHHVAYVQVADHPGRHEPGTGEIDHGFLLARIRELGYTGAIGLECSPRDGEDAAIERIAALAPSTATGSQRG